MYDPVRLEVFRNLFSSVAEEMGMVLTRCAFSPNIKERRDLSCALFDEKGELVAQAAHIPVHLGSMPFAVKSALSRFDFEPGDMVVFNDPYLGGTHLPDVTVIAPVFWEGKLCFFVANRAHHADIGGMSPGSMPLSESIYQEGLIIPPVKLVKRGKLDEEIFDFILSNVRVPEEREGDFSAQIGANRRGILRLTEVIERYGIDAVRDYAAFLQDYAEKSARQFIKRMPAGEYYFEDFLDNDGLTEKAVKIAVRVKVEDGHLVFDFSPSDDEVEGPLNAVRTITISCVLYVLKCILPDYVPANAGIFRCVDVVTRRGSVVDARKPKAVSAGNVETSQRIVDVCLGALSFALDFVPAASQGTMNNVCIGGVESPFVYYETIGGGMGASRYGDGESAIHSHMTNTMNTPVEALEFAYPFRVVRYEVRRGSGGGGRRKGGDGIVREYLFLEDAEVTVVSERRRFAPYGLFGGSPGARGLNLLVRDGKEEVLPSKCRVKVKRGDRLRIETPGGGGYGAE
ncbi:MAG: hydantoinase B/oxoprolinase family protein [Deferribacteres bacterium]|nr:hydantoinase B/oxoprolinase family protein [Deferribacteres bacterium]